MKKTLIGLVICLLLLSAISLGCFEDSGDDKPKNKEPIADAGQDMEVSTGTKIFFDGTNSSDPNGEIVSYSWDFDDYQTPGKELSSAKDPFYIYEYPGEYYVTLTVEDDSGAISTDTIIIIVNNRPPIAEIGQDVITSVFEVIYFNGSATDPDGYITEYSWDFENDGEIDWSATSLGSTTHFYKEAGEYQAQFMVVDDYGENTTVLKNITVNEIIKEPPVAEAGLNQTIPIGQALLQGTGADRDGKIVLYEWDFDGDGTYDWSSKRTGIVYHNYTDEGVYSLSFRVTDDSGLTDTDSITVIVNKSLIKFYSRAEIFIDWNISYDYIVLFNSTVNYSEVDITITDLISKEQETFVSEQNDFDIINETRIKLTSTLLPIPGSSLQVQVFYFETLIGVRSLDIVNHSYEVISPDIDFLALYDFEKILTETDRGDIEQITITSIGELELEQYGDLIYTTLHGTGEYYVFDEYDGGKTQITVKSTDMWLNITYSNGVIITETISFVGQGEMTSDYEDMEMEIDIKTMRLKLENNIELENYMYGEGEFSGTTTDPSSGVQVEISGQVFITNELLGRGIHKNLTDAEFDCSIYYSNLTLKGSTSPAAGGLQTKISTIFLNTSWIVDLEKYKNNTIYYEYSVITTVANLEFRDSGSGYPVNSPEIRAGVVHISDAMYFDTPRPHVLLGQDKIILESEYDVKLKLTVASELEIKVGGKYYQCVEITGEVILGGSGKVSLRLIREGTFAGVTIRTNKELNWKNESLYLNQVMKKLNTT